MAPRPLIRTLLPASLVLALAGAALAAPAADAPTSVGQQIGAAERFAAKGQFPQAIDEYSKAIASGQLSDEHLAKALYRRGLAYRQLGRSASAITDLTQSLYLKGLSQTERQDAVYNRGLAYKQAGVMDRAEVDLKAGRPAGSDASASPSVATAPAAAAQALSPSRRSAAVQSPPTPATPFATSVKPATVAPPAEPAPSEQAAADNGGGLGNFFGSLFSGFSQPEAPAVAEAPPPSRREVPRTTASVPFQTVTAPTNAPAPPASSATVAGASTAAISQPKDIRPGAAVPAAPALSAAPAVTAPSRPPAAATPAAALPKPAEPVQVASAPPAADTPAASEPAPAGGFFQNLFSGAPAAPAEAEPKSQPAPAQAASAPREPLVDTGPIEGVRLQIANLKTESEARDLIGQIRRSQSADIFEGRKAIVHQSSIPSMGTFYHVQVGPFESESAGRRECLKLRQSGLECMTVR